MSSSLSRFVDAQEALYDSVLDELRSGKKISHWMWFVFPQITGLGTSGTARFYAIRNREEAAAYLDHPVLGERLRESFRTILSLEGLSALQIFGAPDDLKLRSSATLFASISTDGSYFHEALAKFFEGMPDLKTLKILEGSKGATPSAGPAQQ